MLRILALTTVLAAGVMIAGCSHDETQTSGLDLATAQPLGFFYLDEGDSAKLAYGEANSDNVGLMMECAKGSRTVQVTDLVRSNTAPTLSLISNGVRADLPAAVETEGGPAIVTASLKADAPALAGFRRSGVMEVAYAGLRYDMRAAPAERERVEQFFTACGSPAKTGANRT